MLMTILSQNSVERSRKKKLIKLSCWRKDFRSVLGIFFHIFSLQSKSPEKPNNSIVHYLHVSISFHKHAFACLPIDNIGYESKHKKNIFNMKKSSWSKDEKIHNSSNERRHFCHLKLQHTIEISTSYKVWKNDNWTEYKEKSTNVILKWRKNQWRKVNEMIFWHFFTHSDSARCYVFLF
jgi:excinuclease UvrABC ATPase subunit